MFSFLRKKEENIKIIDKIVMTQEAKWKMLSSLYQNEKNTTLIFWFDETLRNAESYFKQKESFAPELQTVKEIHSLRMTGGQIVFAEHYPLSQKEKEFFSTLQLNEVQVWSSLDEPLFRQFGSEKIIQMMKQMGMKEEQVIEHSMISKAIQNAQEKMSKKIPVDQGGSSQEEWLERNWTNS